MHCHEPSPGAADAWAWPAAVGAGGMGLVRRPARQRLRSGRYRTISTACGSSTRAGGPKGRLVFLRWQLSDRGFRGRPLPESHSPPTGRPRGSGDGVRVTMWGTPALLQTRGKNFLIDPVWADRASPSLRRTQARECAGHRIRRPAEDRRRAGDAQSLRPSRFGTIGRLWQRFRSRIVTPLGNDMILKGAVPDIAADAWIGMRRSTSATARARRADPALVGARHWRSQHALWTSFVVQAGARIYASATAARRPAPLSRACAGAIPSLRWRCCRSAPTSRAGSCASPT